MSGWTEEGLAHAWRALIRQKADEDWRFVHLITIGNVSVEAGCHFPVGREALIVSFPRTYPVNSARLPQGQGFDVSCIDGQTIFLGRTAIALVRRPEGSPDIFAIMVVDILRVLEIVSITMKRGVMDTFLERVREWQAFMTRTHAPLSSNAQIGLFGELWMLRLLMDTSLGSNALSCWLGPLRAAQDFHILEGAVEVKSTAGTGRFLAQINSIDQLDCDRTPLFLCAFRFEENTDGLSLADLVAQLRVRLEQVNMRRGFEALLLVMGYLDEHTSLYERALTLKESRVFRANSEMPCLRRSALPAAIRSAAYMLDLDAVKGPKGSLLEMITEFGLN